MHRRSFARGARTWPAGSLAAALALLGASAAFGSTHIIADRSAGWHGREIRDPRPYEAANTNPGRPAGWSAGAVCLGSGYRRAGGSQRVRDVQRRLRGRGYRPGRVDGRFGRRTRAALLSFQVKHGLRQYGAVDATTLAALRSRPSRRQRAAAPLATAHTPTVAAALTPPRSALSGTDTAALVVTALVLLGGLVVIVAWTTAAQREAANPTREGSPQHGSEGRCVPPAGRSDERRPAGAVAEHPYESGVWCEPPADLVDERPPAEPGPADPAGRRIQPPPPADPPARLVAVPQRRIEHVRHARPSRVLGYVTVLPGQAREAGLDPATEAIAKWCERHGWELTRVIHDVEFGAGRMADRPGLSYALNQIGEGAVAGIVLARMRDLAGSLSELGTRLRRLVEADAFVVALDYEIDTSTASGNVAARALVEVSDWERARFSERSRRALATARSKRAGAGRPAVRDDPELSARIAAMRARGLTLQAIADTLNDEQVPTVRGGTQWRPSSVQAATGYKRPPERAQGIELPRIWRDPAVEPEDRRA